MSFHRLLEMCGPLWKLEAVRAEMAKTMPQKALPSHWICDQLLPSVLLLLLQLFWDLISYKYSKIVFFKEWIMKDHMFERQRKEWRQEKFRVERDSNPWPLRCRCNNWTTKPTGSWPHHEFMIYPQMVKNTSENLFKYHIFELQRKRLRRDWSLQFYTQLTQLWN